MFKTCASFLLATGLAVQAQYTYTNIDVPGAVYTVCSGISGSNIVGYYSPGNSVFRGFLYNGSNFTSLDMPGTSSTYAYAISGSNIVGTFGTSDYHGGVFLYDGATYSTLDLPSGSLPSGISGTNIVGTYQDKNYFNHAFLYSGGTVTTYDVPAALEGIFGTYFTGISGTNIVGYYFDKDANGHGFIFNGNTYSNVAFPGASQVAGSLEGTFPWSISGSNVAGYYSDSSSSSAGFFYSGGKFTGLDVPGATDTFAYGLSQSAIVGSYFDANGTVHGFLAEPLVFGLDVSINQGSIDWPSVAATGTNFFAYVKATSGVLGNDGAFSYNITQAKNAGLKVGTYHFAYPNYNTNNTGVGEADHFLASALPYITPGNLLPVLDIEDDPKIAGGSYPSTLGTAGLAQWIRDFDTEVFLKTGVHVVVYCNPTYVPILRSFAADYQLWIANYTENYLSEVDVSPWDSWSLFQYTQSGDLPGINEDVDLDVFQGSKAAFTARLVIPPPSIKAQSLDAGANGRFRLEINAAGTQQVTIQSSEDLVNWDTAGVSQVSAGVATFEDTAAPTTLRFYRIAQ